MKVGYMRVSKRDQNPDLQRRDLEAAGCERIFGEKASGAKAEREELQAALDYVREGDVFVVWKLDRLGRSLKDLIVRMEDLQERGVGFASVTEDLDTTTPGGRLVYHVFGALAEWEREVIRERTRRRITKRISRYRLSEEIARASPSRVGSSCVERPHCVSPVTSTTSAPGVGRGPSCAAALTAACRVSSGHRRASP